MNEQLIAVGEIKRQAFINELRSATGEAHKRLEATPLSTALTGEDVSPAEYATYLRYMREVIAYCESDVYALVKDIVPDIEQRRKLPAIEADLAIVGDHASAETIPPYSPASPMVDAAFAMGYVYVMEGSTLGGRMLLNHVGRKLKLDENNGVRFFAGYGAATGVMWKRFLDSLSGYGSEEIRTASVIAGASHAFESIEDYFNRYRK